MNKRTHSKKVRIITVITCDVVSDKITSKYHVAQIHYYAIVIKRKYSI